MNGDDAKKGAPPMDWNPVAVLAPRWVSTPSIECDVARYFCEPGDPSDLVASLQPENGHKLEVLAERLEFIDHLVAISTEFRRQTMQTADAVPLDESRLVITVHDHLMLWGHDFAGADRDIEALCIYLLLTCIDTIKGSIRYFSAFEWLEKDHAAAYAAATTDEAVRGLLHDHSVQYSSAHGLSKRFIAAFMADLSPDLQDRLVSGLAVVRLGDGQVDAKSAAAWQKRNRAAKLKKIAEEFYRIRSAFTHASVRGFAPVQPVATLRGTASPVLVRLPGGEDLVPLLRTTVAFLARRLLMGR